MPLHIFSRIQKLHTKAPQAQAQASSIINLTSKKKVHAPTHKLIFSDYTMSYNVEKIPISKMCFKVIARLPQRLKSTVFEIFFLYSRPPLENPPLEKISKNVDFSSLWNVDYVLKRITY